MISGGWPLESSSCVTAIEAESPADVLPAGSSSPSIPDDGADQLVDRGPTDVEVGERLKGFGSDRVPVRVVAPPHNPVDEMTNALAVLAPVGADEPSSGHSLSTPDTAGLLGGIIGNGHGTLLLGWIGNADRGSSSIG